MTDHKVEKQITIDAPAKEVWDALTNPEKIKQYMFGAEAVSKWKEGSSLLFQGEHEGQKYMDRGRIIKYDEENVLRYTYLSSFSGLGDKPGNYSFITYKLDETNGGTQLTLLQENIQSKEAREHSDKNWETVLDKIKDIVEN